MKQYQTLHVSTNGLPSAFCSILDGAQQFLSSLDMSFHQSEHAWETAVRFRSGQTFIVKINWVITIEIILQISIRVSQWLPLEKKKEQKKPKHQTHN